MPSAAPAGSARLGKGIGVGKESFNQRSPESLHEMTIGSMVPAFKPVAPSPIKKLDSAVQGREDLYSPGRAFLLITPSVSTS